MGFAWKGNCWPDTSTALEAFKKDTVTMDAVGITTFTAVPTINETGRIAWSISHRPLTGTAATTRTGTTQLPTCTQFADNKFELLAVQDVIAAIGIGLAFVVGIVAGNMR